MPQLRLHTRHMVPALVALALVLACLLPSVRWTGFGARAGAADDGTCVGRGEYKRIKGGMSIEKLGQVLHGQTPFVDTEGKGRQRVRWYVACDAWQPDKDVRVRYHQPVVGRRTVTGKKLAVYVA